MPKLGTRFGTGRELVCPFQYCSGDHAGARDDGVFRRVALASLVVFLVILSLAGQPDATTSQLSRALAELSPDVFPPQTQEAQRLRQAWPELLREGLQQANRRSSQVWRNLRGRADWEQFRREKLAQLRQALAIPESPPPAPRIVVTGGIRGEGYRVENLLYESRPGFWVSANLYLPDKPPGRPVGLILVHSHHTPKWHHELQDMGILWAKAGAAVLVPDLLGHGERRIHPFVDAQSFPQPFRVARQDYYFRYNTAAQLYLLGETLMGWMVWDLRSGVDVLWRQAQADPQRIGILGSVAGGGDVAAVTAAVDERFAAAVIFNFGGPEPEDEFPLPDDAEEKFHFAGSGSWESTRNLISSARDGSLPWVIVGAIAPRRLCYAHEFSWDRQRDPVWKRLQEIWGWYEATKHLRYAYGRGRLSGRPPESTHCTHIGTVHRQFGVYQALQAWFGLPIRDQENMTHYSVDELTCWTDAARQQLQPLSWPDWLQRWSMHYKPSRYRARAYETADQLWASWARRYADRQAPNRTAVLVRQQKLPRVRAQWWVLHNLDGMPIPVLLLQPEAAPERSRPCVLVVCSQGKSRFLREHAGALAQLLNEGIEVCLTDVRGVGEMATESVPSRTGSGTTHAATALMLGDSAADLRLFDLLAVLRWLRGQEQRHTDSSARHRTVTVWGTNFAPINPPATKIEVPWDVGQLPTFADPTGPRLALRLAALDKQIVAVIASGELATYRSALTSPFLFMPLAAIEPGMLTCGDGDTSALIRRIAPRPLRLEALVDARNRALVQPELSAWLAQVHASLRQDGHRNPELWLHVCTSRSGDGEIAAWLARQLGRQQQ